MTPTASTDDDSRVYETRLKGRLQNVQKKYDDIFSAVFKKTRSTECLAIIPRYRGHRRLSMNSVCSPVQHHFEEANRQRFSSECDSIGTSDSGSQSPASEPNDNDIIEVEEDSDSVEPPSLVVIAKHKCDCGSHFMKHHELHEHIVEQHSFARLFRCTTCSITIKGIRNNYVCKICKKFVACNMEDHLRGHYQDRQGENAFMECRCCYKTFKTVEEVRSHERRVHYVQRQKQAQWPCEYCPKIFNTRHNRDAHLVGHVNNAVGGIWEKIAQMQELLTDQTLVNQCPICDSVMGSRKSFRLHIIHKHLLRDTSHFITAMGLPTVSEILKAMRSNAGIRDESEVKKEIKEEVMECEPTALDHPEIKTEPVN